jgi:Lipocalin-like domain
MKERSMHKRIAVVPFMLIMMCLCMLARADENPLLGTWRLKSFVREVAGTGDRYNQLGEHPDGYLSYSSDGRMFAFFVSGDQPRPRNEPTDEERIRLHRSMIAYGGTYSLSPGSVVHHIDIEWDGRRIGTDQVRYYTIDGDTLSIKTESNKSPVDGREGVGVLMFEKVKGSESP